MWFQVYKVAIIKNFDDVVVPAVRNAKPET